MSPREEQKQLAGVLGKAGNAFWNARPMLLGAMGALFGGVLALHLPVSWLLALGAVSLVLFLPLAYKRKVWCLLPLLLGITLLRGIFLPRNALPQGTHTLSGQVISLPEEVQEGTERYKQATLRSLKVDGESFSGTLEVLLPLETAVEYGDFIVGESDIQPKRGTPVVPRTQGEGTFQTPVSVTQADGPRLYGWVLHLRERVEQTAEILFAPYAGEAKGMLLGLKADIRYSSYQSFVQSGLVHLLTVSGLHVGILCSVVLWLIRGKPWLRGLLAGAFLLIYTALTGFSPSTMRAAMMAFALFLMRVSGKQEDSLSALATAFVLLVVLDPRYLTNLGFQLSFGSVWGLFMLTEPLSRILPGEQNALWSGLAGSTAAFLGTLKMPL